MADPETSPTAGDEPPWLKSMRRSLPVVLIVLIVSIFGGFKAFWDGFAQGEYAPGLLRCRTSAFGR
jgi:hypothetical protein